MEDSPTFFITYNISVKMIRLLGEVLMPTTISLTMGIERTEKSKDAEIELGINKTRYWFDNIVSRSVAVNQESETALSLLIDSEGSPKIVNPLMLCPDEPRDEVLAALFQSKVMAFGAGSYEVVFVDIETDTLKGLGFSLGGDHGCLLPETVEEWLGEKGYFEYPWWRRDDASTFDIFSKEESTDTPSWAFSLDFLDSSIKSIKTKPATIYKFKPVVINCEDEEKK